MMAKAAEMPREGKANGGLIWIPMIFQHQKTVS
jgi:hypothetical protein